ncbi:uncharacterized protein THITE_2086059 [Thermothielavioides terrestris NRRL 8126]|uniref:Uncharacterized protein n=1 Tax=Thermothielavioides terrestris (strain ATCC 38088 / NRRL 8126) TaxID=578455 RepID=G2QUL2_THETT|nr:uncharacterized protein THITE_2086059 [Thermothielavioides terrestris NRRL 8126]AEO64567.1 hypothetical protein THITE_2086059 [Thermothielavioides terrestris NRRL 8126]
MSFRTVDNPSSSFLKLYPAASPGHPFGRFPAQQGTVATLRFTHEATQTGLVWMWGWMGRKRAHPILEEHLEAQEKQVLVPAASDTTALGVTVAGTTEQDTQPQSRPALGQMRSRKARSRARDGAGSGSGEASLPPAGGLLRYSLSPEMVDTCVPT